MCLCYRRTLALLASNAENPDRSLQSDADSENPPAAVVAGQHAGDRSGSRDDRHRTQVDDQTRSAATATVESLECVKVLRSAVANLARQFVSSAAAEGIATSAVVKALRLVVDDVAEICAISSDGVAALRRYDKSTKACQCAPYC